MRVLSLLLVVALLTGCLPYQFHGLPLQTEMSVSDAELTRTDGQPARLSDFRGKVTLVYFGYTFCPDVCPTTLSTVNKAFDLLGNKADQVQLVMISVDPERDTPESLGAYLANFNPKFIGLTGTPDQIAAVATPLGIYYKKHDGSAATGYLVDHTASLMVLDAEGRPRLVIPFQTSAQDIAEDLKHLL